MESRINLYLTLDYELFLGNKTGTPQNCMVKPMKELCDLSDKYNFKFIVFVDGAYLYKMHQIKDKYNQIDFDYKFVSENIKWLASQGHDVQFHFHPQWLYSTWDVGKKEWVMDRLHYKLSDIKYSEINVHFRASKFLLDDILGYKTTAFRAGGFCLDSFKEYKNLFWELGLKIDSSVARGAHVFSKIHYYDYRKIPSDQIYPFEDSIKAKDIKGRFIELSISSVSWSSLKYIRKILPLKSDYYPNYNYGNGEGISDGKNLYWNRFLKLFSSINTLASIDGDSANLLEIIFKEISLKNQSDIVLIGHPKLLSDLSLLKINRFFENNRDKFRIKTTQSILSENEF